MNKRRINSCCPWIAAIAGILAFAGSGLCSAEDDATRMAEVEAAKRQYKDERVWFVPAVGSAPAIDGVIEDLWKTSGAHRFTWQSYGKGNKAPPAGRPEKPTEATDAWLLCDREHLYIAFRCESADTRRLKGYPPPHELDKVDWKKHDLVEVILDPGRTRQVAFAFGVECFGAFTDVLFDPNKHGTERNAYGEHIPWTSAGVEYKTATDERGYTVEVKIPFKALGIEQGKVSRHWGINLCRQNPVANEDTAIAFTGRVASGRPAHFGTAILEIGTAVRKDRDASRSGSGQRKEE